MDLSKHYKSSLSLPLCYSMDVISVKIHRTQNNNHACVFAWFINSCNNVGYIEQQLYLCYSKVNGKMETIAFNPETQMTAKNVNIR